MSDDPGAAIAADLAAAIERAAAALTLADEPAAFPAVLEAGGPASGVGSEPEDRDAAAKPALGAEHQGVGGRA